MEITGKTPQFSSLFAFFMSHFLLLHCPSLVSSTPPPEPIKCSSSGGLRCTVTNAYGSYPDRSTCSTAAAYFPTSEQDVIKIVANATASKRKMKVATRYSNSFPKLSCPGSGAGEGIVISTRNLDRVLSVDSSAMTITVQGGVVLRDLINAAAAAGLALPYTPYWWGLTIAGLISTGAHGSSLWGKGSAVHEYVIGLRLVSPAAAEEGYAKVWEVDVGHEYMEAAKVSLGVLGVITQVTLQLQPLFKRSITFSGQQSDSDLADIAFAFGQQHEFADLAWYLDKNKVIYRIDDRVPINVSGNGVNDFIGFRSTATIILAAGRLAEESLEDTGNAAGKCLDSHLTAAAISIAGYGYTNDGVLFKGFPVVGYQHRLQSSGSCIDSPNDGLLTACPWDPRVDGVFYYQTVVSIAISEVKDFILDVQKLRDINPKALCGLGLYDGVLMRYVKASPAYLGKQEDSVDFDFTYYRSHGRRTPRLYEDFIEEIEQMALFKYGGLPHWGKNRNLAFDGAIRKYGAAAGEFLKAKDYFDPDGLFSSQWSDQVLGIAGRASIFREGCALEGLCVCSADVHCSPEKNYYCRAGKVYRDARVCTYVKT